MEKFSDYLKERRDAIKAVYGKEALNENKTVYFNGEVFTAWAVEGYKTFKDLLKDFNIVDAEFIYDSGE